MEPLTYVAIAYLILTIIVHILKFANSGGTEFDLLMWDIKNALHEIGEALGGRQLVKAIRVCRAFVVNHILLVVAVTLFVLSFCQLLHQLDHNLEDGAHRRQVYEVEKNRQRLPDAKVGEKIFLEKL